MQGPAHPRPARPRCHRTLPSGRHPQRRDRRVARLRHQRPERRADGRAGRADPPPPLGGRAAPELREPASSASPAPASTTCAAPTRTSSAPSSPPPGAGPPSACTFVAPSRPSSAAGAPTTSARAPGTGSGCFTRTPRCGSSCRHLTGSVSSSSDASVQRPTRIDGARPHRSPGLHDDHQTCTLGLSDHACGRGCPLGYESGGLGDLWSDLHWDDNERVGSIVESNARVEVQLRVVVDGFASLRCAGVGVGARDNVPGAGDGCARSGNHTATLCVGLRLR